MSLSPLTSAPSNIALIKYMGKTSAQQNRPTNASLSYTLDELKTYVSVEPLKTPQTNHDEWQLLEGDSFFHFPISEHGRKRYLKHLQLLKQSVDCKEPLLIKSANNFPSDCGLASSASSFAALTKAAFDYFEKQGLIKRQNLDIDVNHYLSQLSQKGSGSSCRSFFKPWSIWEDQGARPVPELDLRLLHMVVIVDDKLKAVSSSQAHKLVQTSLNFKGRPERAEMRLSELIQALQAVGSKFTTDWQRAFDLCWQEFMDMHSLFETSQPPFHYMTDDSMKVLNQIRQHWQDHQDGPLVTMDAGPNVHFLFREDQKETLKKLKDDFSQNYRVFSSV